MLHELTDSVPQGPFSEQDHLIQTVLLDRLHEPLCEGIQVR
jgi:hypothetical protein